MAEIRVISTVAHRSIPSDLPADMRTTSHHMIRNSDAEAVLLALMSFTKRANQIVERIGDQPNIAGLERVKLQGLYGELKEDLQVAATRGTILPGLRVQTSSEQHFFVPAVIRALKSLRPRSNSNPVASGWVASLTEAIGHVDEHMKKLEILCESRGPESENT
jgi:hypothetical protein